MTTTIESTFTYYQDWQGPEVTYDATRTADGEWLTTWSHNGGGTAVSPYSQKEVDEYLKYGWWIKVK